MKFFIETLRKLGIGKVLALSILCSGAALAQDVPVEPAMFKGDIAWMMTAIIVTLAWPFQVLLCFMAD